MADTGQEHWESEDVGGDPVCYMHLLCEECGAVTTEGHREGCSLAGTSAGADDRTSR